MVDYFDSVYEFQWEPSKRIDNINNQTFYIASPASMCSDFILSLQQRGNISYIQQSLNYTYPLLYASYYLNRYPDQNLETMNYTIDDAVLEDFRNFVLQCQSKQQNVYDYFDKYCTNPLLNG